MLLYRIIKQYRRDCKEYGKDKLAVPLVDRLAWYALLWGVILGASVGIERII